MLFKTRDIFIFAVIAGMLVSVVLLALPWPRKRQRWLIAGVGCGSPRLDRLESSAQRD
jgi:hypothetical protein